jgi:hypothetical protein
MALSLRPLIYTYKHILNTNRGTDSYAKNFGYAGFLIDGMTYVNKRNRLSLHLLVTYKSVFFFI